jgi:hypothetical protein
MSVQKIYKKIITKYDTSNPNFIEKPEPKVEVNGNVSDDDDIYGEKKHTYVPDANGNLQMEQLMGKLMNKLDGIPGVTNGQTGINAIEVDIKREIAIGKVDVSAVKSEEFVGKVKTNKNKLRELRRRR